jgi:galactokinase
MLERDLPTPARVALEAYRTRIAPAGDARPTVVAWAPGRVNLIGEHTDYNDGWVLPVAIDHVVALAGRAHPTSTASTASTASGGGARVRSVHHDEEARFGTSRAALGVDSPAGLPMWARYVRGVVAELAAVADEGVSGGFDAAIAGDVPLGGGLSSSAALEVATATFIAASGGPALPPMETARLCQRAELRGVGVRCGILDQAASRLGRSNAALLLDCRSLAYEYVPFDFPDLALAVFDTGVAHTLSASGYNERRRECEEAVALLAAAVSRVQPGRTIHALRDVTRADLVAFGDALPPTILRRVRHVVGENERVLDALAALRAGDDAALGSLIAASHASLRDDFAVSCAELDAAVRIAADVRGVLGARMMGAGFGGSALILVQKTALADLGASLARAYPAETSRSGELRICRVAGGPGSTEVRA